jgi:hypothetical protein
VPAVVEALGEVKGGRLAWKAQAHGQEGVAPLEKPRRAA